MQFAGIVTAAVGLIIIATSLPLIYRKVPRNDLYGIRIDESLKSDERWYEINEFGGRELAKAGVVMMVSGLAALFIPEQFTLAYVWVNLFATVMALAVAVFRTFSWARRKR